MDNARLSMGDILVPEEGGIRGRGTFPSQSPHTCPLPHTPGLSVTPKPSSGPRFSVTEVPRVWGPNCIFQTFTSTSRKNFLPLITFWLFLLKKTGPPHGSTSRTGLAPTAGTTCPVSRSPTLPCVLRPLGVYPLGAPGQQGNQRGATSSIPGVRARLVAHRVPGIHGPAAPSDLE